MGVERHRQVQRGVVHVAAHVHDPPPDRRSHEIVLGETDRVAHDGNDHDEQEYPAHQAESILVGFGFVERSGDPSKEPRAGVGPAQGQLHPTQRLGVRVADQQGDVLVGGLVGQVASKVPALEELLFLPVVQPDEPIVVPDSRPGAPGVSLDADDVQDDRDRLFVAADFGRDHAWDNPGLDAVLGNRPPRPAVQALRIDQDLQYGRYHPHPAAPEHGDQDYADDRGDQSPSVPAQVSQGTEETLHDRPFFCTELSMPMQHHTASAEGRMIGPDAPWVNGRCSGA